MNSNLIKTAIATSLSLVFALGGGAAFAETIRIGGTGVALGGMQVLSDAFEECNPDVTIEILPSLGSSGGVRALVVGAIDLSVSSRAMKDTELEQGVEARLYATTPLAIVTSSDTQTDGVTTQQLAEMYAGTLLNWPSGERVRVVLRPASESDVQVLRGLSEDVAIGVDAAFERPGLVVATNDQKNAETLEELSGSIGAVALGQIATENRRLKVLTLDGMLPHAGHPEDTSLEDSEAHQHSMAFSKSLYLVRTAEISTTAAEFAAFVFSPEGQDILSAYDHTPLR